jgi:hypothetical protein
MDTIPKIINSYRNQNSTIKKFTLYGERHSGTNVFEKFIKMNFDMEVTWEYDWKHFFGFADIESIIKAKDTLFLCIVRDTYDWLLANHYMPHDAPRDREGVLYVNDWYSVSRTIEETEIMEDRCYWDKERYQNIFELRYFKLMYMLYVLPMLADNYLFISYNSFIKDQLFYLNYIHDTFNIEYLPRDFSSRKVGLYSPRNYTVSDKDLKHINDNVYWKIENECGFFKKDHHP